MHDIVVWLQSVPTCFVEVYMSYWCSDSKILKILWTSLQSIFECVYLIPLYLDAGYRWCLYSLVYLHGTQSIIHQDKLSI